MNILILDDDTRRHSSYAVRLKDHTVKHVMTMHDFMTEVNMHRWDIVYLDHDLNEHQFKSVWGNGDKQTGVDAADFLVRRSLNPSVRVIIHSWNEIGAMKMAKLLRSRGFRVVLEPWVPSGTGSL